MKYSTLSYLVALMNKDIETRRGALELARKTYNMKVDEADGMSNRKEAKEHISYAKEIYDRARENLLCAEQALADFTEHDFR
jgi:hypothetical protein